MTTPHETLQAVRARIEARSADARAQYLADMAQARRDGPARARLSCSNLAHVFAAAGPDKPDLKGLAVANLGIVTAYNDMLSAHQPLAGYPDVIKRAAREAGATAQVAGGVPAMCDGVTQGQGGMELSLFSRDVIALAAAVALSHDAFDAAIMLGVCDKIVPGLFLAAARFGHLPIAFAPAGPMPSGVPNPEKARVRKRYAAGEATRAELLEAEAQSYHSPGTCTFYGTANSNQMLMEAMGLHVPGAAFVPPGTPLREALTREAARAALRACALRGGYRPFAAIIDARSFINAMVGLMATGGSTNHALHLVAMARAIGLETTWEDMAAISRVTPLLARVYPNGEADVNHFHAAGGMAFVMAALARAGLLFDDAETLWGQGLAPYAQEPVLHDGALVWRDPPSTSQDPAILRAPDDPFDAEGGLRLLEGGLGRAIVKTSALAPQRRALTAPARVFDDVAAFEAAFAAGALNAGDFVAVVRFQGPRANGMPELHALTTPLAVLQDRGARVALVTDGRLSGASGAVLAAIHVTPEASEGGPLARVRDGDVVAIDADAGTLEARVEGLMARPLCRPPPGRAQGLGRELFALFRERVGPADRGACAIF